MDSVVGHGMWDRPRPGTELVSSVLAGDFLTTGPQGKSQHILSIYTGHVFVHFPIYEEVGDSRVRYLCFFFFLDVLKR